MTNLNYDPRPEQRRKLRDPWWRAALPSIATGWLLTVIATVAAVVVRFDDIDENGTEFAGTDKLLTALFGCTAIVVLTLIAAIAVYVNRDRL